MVRDESAKKFVLLLTMMGLLPRFSGQAVLLRRPINDKFFQLSVNEPRRFFFLMTEIPALAIIC